MPSTINQQLADALTLEQLDATRMGMAQRQALFVQLSTLEGLALAALKAMDPPEPVLLVWRQRRVRRLLSETLAPLVEDTFTQMATATRAMLVALALDVVARLNALVNAEAETHLFRRAVSETLLARLIEETAFPSASTAGAFSAPLPVWWGRLQTTLTQRFTDQLLVSVGLEESLTQAAARIRGTAEQAFTDGVMAQARREVAMLLDAAVTRTVTAARTATITANAPSVRAIMHQSILDARTSLICTGRNGLRYTADTHAPIGHALPFLGGPPYHWHCRSTMVPLLMDGGPVDMGNFDAFFRRQSITKQRAILGPSRLKLWQDGRLSLRQLLDAATGSPLTLKELRV